MALRLRSGMVLGLSLVAVTLGGAAAREQTGCGPLPGQARSHPELRHGAEGEALRPTGSLATSQTTQLTDLELNSYLHYHLKDQVPAGVVDPTLNALGDGRVRGARRHRSRRGPQAEGARVDRSDELPDRPAAADGRGRCSSRRTASADSSSSRPRSPASRSRRAWCRNCCRYYSKSAEKPSGISIDDPFELPAAIKEIRVGKGEATVVQ